MKMNPKAIEIALEERAPLITWIVTEDRWLFYVEGRVIINGKATAWQMALDKDWVSQARSHDVLIDTVVNRATRAFADLLFSGRQS